MKGPTIGYRFMVAFLMAVASFITGLVIWLFFFYVGMELDYLIPFSPVFLFALAFTLYGFISPDKSIDVIGVVWAKLGDVMKALLQVGP